MVYHRNKIFDPGAARRMDAKKIAGTRKYRWLVHHHPMLYPVAEMPGTNLCIVAEPIHNLAIGPTTLKFKRLGQVPMVHGYPWFDALLQAIIDHAVIVIDTLLIDLTGAIRYNTGPGN